MILNAHRQFELVSVRLEAVPDIPVYSGTEIFRRWQREAQKVGRSVDLFYKSLSEGSWFDVEDYGYCWQPDVAVNNSSWRPYTDGYWAYADVGWTWISYEDFGWATYHYGAWTRLKGQGWVWFPSANLDWGPAWVSWRQGEDVIGWAPFPPRGPGIVYVGEKVTGNVDDEFGISAGCYNFCGIKFMGEPVLRSRILDLRQNQTYMDQTRNATNIAVRSNRAYNYGVDVNVVNQYSSRPVQKLLLEQGADIDTAIRKSNAMKVEGNSVIVAAPQTLERPTKQIEPPPVKAKMSKDKLERGW
jgi:hypothetical protein